jgi:hypothetical protein
MTVNQKHVKHQSLSQNATEIVSIPLQAGTNTVLLPEVIFLAALVHSFMATLVTAREI